MRLVTRYVTVGAENCKIGDKFATTKYIDGLGIHAPRGSCGVINEIIQNDSGGKVYLVVYIDTCQFMIAAVVDCLKNIRSIMPIGMKCILKDVKNLKK